MRKLVLAALAAGILSVMAVAMATAHEDHSTDEWPTTCVDLNDIVEEHLGNTGNVGIYQNTFGDQAEAACQNDHRNDVIAVFGWAIATETGGSAESADLELDWPTTCVELNDIVEGHLGNQGNVAIYQNTFGDQAEAACQNDHRNDVRSVFAWAIGTTDTAPPAPTPAPTPEPAPQPTPSDLPPLGTQLSVAEYAAWCGASAPSLSLQRPGLTWGEIADAYGPWLLEAGTLTPPAVLSEWHTLLFTGALGVNAIANERNAGDNFNPLDPGVLGVVLGLDPSLQEAKRALPADVRAQLLATGCITS